jgi:sugar phosphate isomerase/epimerase
MAQLPIALQLYTVRDETARDFTGTLRKVAEMGYPAVEFAGYGGLPADQLASLLAELGLQAASTHLGFAALDQRLDAELDFCQEIGCRYLVLPALPSEQRGEERIRALTGWFNEVGRRCHERGITFAYHNHDFDFARSSDDHFLLDLLLEHTDPALVALECDAYWATFAGVDPVSYLQRWSGRVPLLHVKDMTSDRRFTEVGDGTLDMSAICRTASAGGTRWYIIENDQPRLPSLESARRSLEYLRGLLPILGIQ